MDNKELYDEKFNNVNKRIDDHEGRISASEDKITEMDKSFEVSFAKVASALENLKELPGVIESMRKTNEDIQISLVSLNSKVDTLDGKVCSLSDKVEQIDSEGKFNIREFIKKNWIAIAVGLAGVIAVGSKFIGG